MCLEAPFGIVAEVRKECQASFLTNHLYVIIGDTSNSNGSYYTGDILVIQCKQGFTFGDHEFTQLTCSADGTWQPEREPAACLFVSNYQHLLTVDCFFACFIFALILSNEACSGAEGRGNYKRGSETR